ncbi:hypothetical protein PG985_010531 [Apiospora marii]|uniref:Uncharacterized protein n=1 Tax=Apiospora marii TaxID=335849 RepID=A0ABR1T175_9PEZI
MSRKGFEGGLTGKPLSSTLQLLAALIQPPSLGAQALESKQARQYSNGEKAVTFGLSPTRAFPSGPLWHRRLRDDDGRFWLTKDEGPAAAWQEKPEEVEGPLTGWTRDSRLEKRRPDSIAGDPNSG